jgi:putative addiction module component (TIGR02574 family)
MRTVGRYNPAMGPRAQEVLKAVLELPENERVDVLGALIENIDGPAQEGVDEAWAAEIKRRIEEVESGAVKTIPWEQVDQELQQILDSRKRA